MIEGAVANVSPQEATQVAPPRERLHYTQSPRAQDNMNEKSEGSWRLARSAVQKKTQGCGRAKKAKTWRQKHGLHEFRSRYLIDANDPCYQLHQQP